jgi:hypothetical protein
MKKRWLPHGITAGSFVVLIVLGLACASSPSAQFSPPEGMQPGESWPSLAGTTWTWKESQSQLIVQFKAGGELVIQGWTEQNNWFRNGDTVVILTSKESNGCYWSRWDGNYDASTQTIWGTRKWSTGGSDGFTLTKYTGASPQAAPAASSGASASSAPSSRAFVVTVWYTSSGTRLSSVYTVEASSKDEAEREAERRWKTQFGWNQTMQFQEAVANF